MKPCEVQFEVTPRARLVCGRFWAIAILVVSWHGAARAQFEVLPLPEGTDLAITPPSSEGEIVPPNVPIEGDSGIPSFWQEVPPFGDPPPIAPTWYNPFTWISPTWDGSFEIGINGSEGNANAFAITTGFELSRETERTNWDVDFLYTKNTANGIETQHNSLLTSDVDYKLTNPRWSLFNKVGLEYDEFNDFNIRLFLNSGVGYLMLDSDHTQFRPRLGTGTSREFGGVEDFWVAEAVFGFDFSLKISSRQKLSAVVDYYPSWNDFRDFRVISDFSWEVVLDEASNLSLKVGALDRYDSTPNGALSNDLNYSVLLLWSI